MVTQSQHADQADALKWVLPDGKPVFVAIRRSHTMRDVRDALAILAHRMSRQAGGASGIGVVVQSRITWSRLQEELDQFRRVLRPDLAKDLFLVAVEGGEIRGSLPDPSAELKVAVFDAVKADAVPSVAKVSRQFVKARLVERWCASLPWESIAEVRRQSGASYQTVSAALSELDTLGAVYEGRDGLPAPLGFTAPMLLKLAEEHSGARKRVTYADPTRNARTPEGMARRLIGLATSGQLQQVAIGGVIGALHYYPELDITAAPRLDVSVYADDIGIVRRIDAGLDIMAASPA